MNGIVSTSQARSSDYGECWKWQSLQFLSGAGRAQGGVLYALDDELNACDYLMLGVESRVHERYLNDFGDIDPFHARYYTRSDRNVITGGTLAGPLRSRWQVYRNEFLKPCGFSHILELFIRDGARIVAGFSLMRSVTDDPFTSSQVALLEQARSYVEFNLQHLARLGTFADEDPLNGFRACLTRKEVQIFDLLCQGASNREISRRLFIQECTTKTHLRHIYGKFSVNNRNELMALVLDARGY